VARHRPVARFSWAFADQHFRTNDAFGDFGTLASFGFLVVYMLVSIGTPVYLKRIGELRVHNVLISAASIALILVAIEGSLVPIPAWPLWIMPYAFLDFLGYAFRPREAIWHGNQHAVAFLPAASPKALKAIRQTVRRWSLRRRSDLTLVDLAQEYNPYLRGWVNYYSHFYRSALHPTLRCVDAHLIRWARNKYKRLRPRPKGARDWLARIHRANPALFAHWRVLHVNGRTSGAV